MPARLRINVEKCSTPCGKMIRIARTKKKLTHADLAKFLNVSPSYVSALECGNRHITLSRTPKERIEHLANKLWLNFEEFRSCIPMPKSNHPPRKYFKVKSILPEQRTIPIRPPAESTPLAKTAKAEKKPPAKEAAALQKGSNTLTYRSPKATPDEPLAQQPARTHVFSGRDGNSLSLEEIKSIIAEIAGET